ncbi:T9SS type A sorting domain-containing protein [Spirosoma flavum]|uniref:T9SS type A sorting domain-containing protein n=1 Tax=Spirosoma flavum TaxID=2048557 RepID=A0ABW6AET4_9BACT
MIKTLLTLIIASVTLVIADQTNRTSASSVLSETLLSETANKIKIPIDPKRWYQVNNADNGLDALFDGATDVTVNTGWGKILTNFDAYYPLQKGEQLSIESIRLYDGAGSNIDAPMTLSIITDKSERIPIARFTGNKYQTWVGPNPDQPEEFALKKPISNARYLVINSAGSYPTEMELYGTYQAGQEPALIPQQSYPFRHTLGINGFEWDAEDPTTGAALREVEDTRINALKSFSSMRHYIDWDKLENQQGSYTYNPTFSGSWTYDGMYKRLQSEGVEMLACLQTLPKWMENIYPEDGRDYSNAPARYGSDLSSPKSYIEHARVAFQYMARYGYNKNVNPSLVSVSPEVTWAGVNTVKIGLGLIRYIECNNEPDKTWKGRNGYQSAREYAANMSAFYDGHKNTLGPGVGVKNADPSVTVVMGGMSTAKTDYMRAMIDWCKEFRGYRPDGSVNLCWDVMNQHLYANDVKSSQNGGATRGAAPELAGVGEQAAAFVKLSRQYAGGMPVWITEAGYDINKESPFRAIPIGRKTVLETQADWILRTSLLYSRVGIDRVFYFQAYDFDILNPTQFSSMGLLNEIGKTRKPAADYLYQAKNLLGNYHYKETLNKDPLVDRYELDGQSAYVLVIPDEQGRTGTYSLSVIKGDTVQICTPTIGRDEMTRTVQVSQTGTVTVNVSETPVFIMPMREAGNKVKTDLRTLQVYPNPTSDYVKLTIENENTTLVDVTVYDNSGRRYKQVSFLKSGRFFNEQLDLSSLPHGSYLLEVRQEQTRVIKKIIRAQ